MKYGQLSLGQVEAMVNKLGGVDGVQRFLSDELSVYETIKVWQTWKTIKLERGQKSADYFHKMICQSDMQIDENGNQILGLTNFATRTEEEEVELVVVSARELGFKGAEVARKDIYLRAKELGLEMCPAEIGPYLRLQYTDQPRYESIIVAMEPILDEKSRPLVFYVNEFKNKGLLSAWNCETFLSRHSSSRFVFMRRKQN